MAFINAREDWNLSIERNKGRFNYVADYFITFIVNTLKNIDIKIDFEQWIEEYVLIQVLLCNVTHWVGSAPASGAEHLFAKCIEDELSELPLHGEVVALGVLIFCYIRQQSVDEIVSLLKKFNISTKFNELNINKEATINALVNSHKEGIRKSRYTILDEIENSKKYYTDVIDSMISDKLIKEK